MAAAPAARTGRLVALAGIAASALLAALNIVVGLLTHSTSVLAAGLEFAGDVLVSAVVVLGLVAAAKPADEDHPYGHGRLESLGAFVVGLVLAVGGALIAWSSLLAVGEQHAPPTLLSAAALVMAIVVRTVMSALKFRVGRRIRSASLVADAWNDAVDILAALTALVAVSLAMLDPARFLAADHYGGFAVGLIVILIGLRVLRDASLELMDTMPSALLLTQLREVASNVLGVRDVEKCYARKTGLQYHVDLHIEVDPTMTVAAAHEIAHDVQRSILIELPWVADVLVHVEPWGGK